MVLILSIQHDISTDMVMDWLNMQNIPVLRINGDEDKYSFYKIDANGVYFKEDATSEIINLSHSSACWWRRLGLRKWHYYSTNILSQGYADYKYIGINSMIDSFIQKEVSCLNEYVLERLYKDIPINLGTPKFDLNRLHVLDLAYKIGLKTPRFEVITSSKQLLLMQDRIGNVVSKAIKDGIYEVLGNERFYTYTELIEKDFVDTHEDISFAPSLIIELIRKKFEIRSFFIDGKFFSMAIFSQGSEDTKIDYRINPPRVEIPYKLPDTIEQKLKTLYETLGLNTGSADLIVNEEDEHVFLEINPVGQFGMTSIPCNYNIEELIGKYLTDGTI